MKKALSTIATSALGMCLIILSACDFAEQARLPIAYQPPSPTQQEPTPRTIEKPNLKIMAFSDMNVDTKGTYNSATKTATSKMIQNEADLILGAGDYIDGEKTNLSSATYTKMWNSFLTSILSPMINANIPFLPSPGNHDAYYTHERSHYSEFWRTKKAVVQYVDDSQYPFYYSFKKDNVFFVSLDSSRYSALYNRQTQLTWLKNQLGSVDAETARARIVYGHIPLYSVASKSRNSSTIYHNGALVQERASRSSFSLEAILLEYNVDLVIFGHSHAYFGGEYTYPNGDTLNVVSLPCAGGTQRYLAGTSIKSKYGYLEIDINSQDQISYQFNDYNGQPQSDLNLPTSITLDSASRVKFYKKE